MGLKRSVEGDEKSRKEGGSAPEIRSPWAGYKTRLPLLGRALPVTAEEGSRHGRRGRSAAGARGWGEQWGSPLQTALLERSLERRHRQGTSTGCIARAVRSTAASRQPLHCPARGGVGRAAGLRAGLGTGKRTEPGSVCPEQGQHQHTLLPKTICSVEMLAAGASQLTQRGAKHDAALRARCQPLRGHSGGTRSDGTTSRSLPCE